MRKVSGRFKEYGLMKKGKDAPDGQVYLVHGGDGQGLCVKLLYDRSKQGEVEASLQGAGSGSLMDAPLDIVFSRGKFAGYVYQDFDAWSGAASAASVAGGLDEYGINYDQGGSLGNGSRGAFWSGPIVKLGILACILILLAVLNIKALHSTFLNFAGRMISPEVAAGCELLGFSGITAVIIGLAFAGLACRKVMDADAPIFWAAEAAAFLAGILAADVAMAVAVQVVMGVVSLLVAVLPILILAAALVAIVKGMFKR